jgi:hypothetical protein
MDPTFVYAPEGDLMLTVHGPIPPTDEEWRAYLEFSRTCVGRVTRSLIVSSGAGPNGRQRTMLMKEFPEFAPVPVAVVSDSSMTRGIVTALRWFGKNIRAFPPSQLAAALEYLGVPPERHAAVLDRVEALTLSLSPAARGITKKSNGERGVGSH